MTSAEYTEKLNQFSRTIEAKSNHKASVVRNSIGDTLSAEYKMLAKINTLELTPENTEVVRSVLNRVFDKLAASGVNFD